MDDQNQKTQDTIVQDEEQVIEELAPVDEKEALIVQLQNEKVELENKWKRALADYSNLERQVLREKSEFMRMASALVSAKFLDVLDHLEMAMGGLTDEDKKNGWAMGVVMTMKQFQEVLKSEGLYEIECEGKPFDAFAMEAVDRVVGEKDVVVKVLKKGYKTMEGKVVRPAQVVVGRGE